eukprot:Unigene1194_Nuclearia_a/m.3819 Unigene1194_Nuclearia_a/g.3819  ORF Unigene1194_Nuclearia_a/g.3819 Unigene1194_Nuclearia_a/m.3819 type:complete len:227 (+) Unigene1194_Nuclearia_a:113-793(+)
MGRGLNLGDEAPSFKALTTEGEIDFHQFLGGAWTVLFSHPADFTPVCTTELGRVAKLAHAGEWAKRNVKIIALSCNAVETHNQWIEDIKASQKVEGAWPYPIISDPDRKLAVEFGMLDPAELDSKGMPVTARAVYIFGPDKKLKLSLLYPATTGRNFDEILRAIDSLQLTVKYSVATPADWKNGDQVMIQPSVSDEAAKDKFPQGWNTVSVPSGKAYIRLTPQPSH